MQSEQATLRSIEAHKNLHNSYPMNKANLQLQAYLSDQKINNDFYNKKTVY